MPFVLPGDVTAHTNFPAPMEMFSDSYNWVMVPNVYGMTQFADGGLMTTKPYISGSNYLIKMGAGKILQQALPQQKEPVQE